MTPIDPITRALKEVRAQFLSERSGALADYIPQLATADPERFGISLVSLDGRIYNSGDTDWTFTIQSVSKAFVYALALTDYGLEAVLERVGAEPSGEAFNAISLEADTGRPANPMVNAGAIVTTSLIDAADPTARFVRILATLSAFAGRQLDVDEAVYQSERETGDRNRALGYLMRSAGSLRANVAETLDCYFRQCAVLVTTRDLAVMAATLANGGVNPVTGATVISDQVASHVLTVMGTCGMYDWSGEWLLRIGVPAKSGVSGALLAAKPAQFGVGLCSPLLDDRGNSVRGVAACRELAERFGLHLMNHPGRAAPATYLETTAAELTSSIPRSDGDRAVLLQHGDAILIRGLQGDLHFAAAEHLLRSFDDLKPGNDTRRWLILDMTRVGRVHRIAQAMLAAMALDLANAGVTLVAVDTHQRQLLPNVPVFIERDAAIAWCEEAALAGFAG